VSIVLVGLNHRTAPLWIRERAAFTSETGAAAAVVQHAGVDEAFVLSTCNRVEAYVAHRGEAPEHAADRVIAMLAGRAAMPAETLRPYLLVQEGDDAVRHLCRVAAGMDSMVVGETQIVAQMRRALIAAQHEGAAGRVLHRLVTTAFAAGKRVRPQLPPAAGPSSVAEAAVHALGGVAALADKSVVVVGAGETAADLLRALAGLRPQRLVLVNRTLHRAAGLAARHGAALASWEALGVVVADADVVFACTSSAAPVIHAGHLAGASARPRTLVDLGVPRNVDAALGALPGTTLLDVEAIGKWNAHGASGGPCPARAAREAAEAVLEEWVARYAAWRRTEAVVPTIAALRADAERMRDQEVGRALARLGPLGDREREIVCALAARVVDKLLHRPLTTLAADGATLAEPARRLFGLDAAPSPAVEPTLTLHTA